MKQSDGTYLITKGKGHTEECPYFNIKASHNYYDQCTDSKFNRAGQDSTINLF